jgi:hypothetical protein
MHCMQADMITTVLAHIDFISTIIQIIYFKKSFIFRAEKLVHLKKCALL